MADVTHVDDGIMMVSFVDDDGNDQTRPASVAEQNAAILKALEGQAVL